MRNLFTRSNIAPPTATSTPIQFEMPTERDDEEKEEAPWWKAGQTKESGSFSEDPVGWAANKANKFFNIHDSGSGDRGSWGVVAGDYLSDPVNAPYVAASALPVAAGGLYGGYKLVDWLLEKRRKSQLSEELDLARRDYEEALAEERGTKAASAVSLDVLYDKTQQLGEKMTKDAGGPLDWANTKAHQALGMWLAVMAASGLAGGVGGMALAGDRSRQQALDKAMRERQRLMWAQRPTAAVAIPSYQDDEEEKQPSLSIMG